MDTSQIRQCLIEMVREDGDRGGRLLLKSWVGGMTDYGEGKRAPLVGACRCTYIGEDDQ
jgi:hypothetical protein